MAEASPIPLYPGSTLMGEYPSGDGIDQIYGTPDLLPKVVDFYTKHLGQPQELDARGLNLTENTIMPQLAQISWVRTCLHQQKVVYHRVGLTPVIPQKQTAVMGANQDKIPVEVGKTGYKTLICIGRKQMPQATPAKP